MIRLILTTLGFVLLFGLINHDPAFAKKSNTALRSQHTLTHDEVIAREPALVNRELQSFVGKIGTRILSQSPVLSEVDVLLLDSGRVDSFHSSSGYIYLTRGLLFLAGDESHIASIVALEVASLEQEWVSEIEHYKRAAEILSASAYNPNALTDFLSILIRHKRYTENNQAAQSAMGQAYTRLNNDRYDSVLAAVVSYASELNSQGSAALTMVPKSDFLTLLNGLAVGQSPSIELKNRGPQIIKASGFTIFLPDSWTTFRRDQVVDAIPFKANALDIESNDSAVVLRSRPKQATEVIVFSLDQVGASRSAEQELKLHIQRVSAKSTVSRQGPINGDNWQGYLIEGRVSVEINGGQEARGISLGSGITSSFNHISAVIPLADKLVIATMFPIMFGNDYSELDVDAFRNIVSSISAQQNGDTETGQTGHRRIKIHKVNAGETIATLASDIRLNDAAQALRVLNGLGLNQQLEAGQLIKLIENRD